MNIKLNVGASPIWTKKGWHTLDHKVSDGRDNSLVGDAANIPLDKSTCSTVFCSHVFEHIPHTKLEDVLLEFNRVLENDGIVRILTPDLKKLATAYVNNDEDLLEACMEENEKIRTDLGPGGMLANWFVSPGQDTVLYNRSLTEFIGGYAHLYCYDFTMLRILLERTGFNKIRQMDFCDSELQDYREPLHVLGHDPVWNSFNQDFYDKNNLVHFYNRETSKYEINFSTTGFDRDPVTSLIVEARKERDVVLEGYESINDLPNNNNAYSQSLLQDEEFSRINSIALNAVRNNSKN
jgi:hypothetical protein